MPQCGGCKMFDIRGFFVLARGLCLALPRNIAELRSAIAAALQSEFLDTAAEGARIELQNCRGSVGTLDMPVGLLEDRDDAILVDLRQRALRGGRRTGTLHFALSARRGVRN